MTDNVDLLGLQGLSMFDPTVPQYDSAPDYCTCDIGRPESCPYHALLSDNFEPEEIPRVDGGYDSLWGQPQRNIQQYPPAISHFTAPPLQQSNGFIPGQQHHQLVLPTYQFASLRLNPEQPPDPTTRISETYTPGDRTALPQSFNQAQGWQGLSMNHVAVQGQRLCADARSDPGPAIQPLQKRSTYAEAAAHGLPGTRMAFLPQEQSGLQHPRVNDAPSDPGQSMQVHTNLSNNISIPMRSSRDATCGSSRPRAPSVCSTRSYRSAVEKRKYARKTSNASTFLSPDSAKFRCKFGCGLSFDSLSGLHKHENNHRPSKDRPFPCHICGMGFLWQKDLDRHMPKHTRERHFRCDECTTNKTFTRHDNLRRHYIKEHPDVDPPSTSSRTGTTVNSSQS